jgi:hypothetical protein
MTERVRRHVLPLRHTGGARVAEERLGHDRLREPAALDTDEEWRFRIVDPSRLERRSRTAACDACASATFSAAGRAPVEARRRARRHRSSNSMSLRSSRELVANADLAGGEVDLLPPQARRVAIR